ncbi:hypothetical protein [Canibacter oris]|uniref:Gram-positive cocci surface proteins LPxTG domain-containing protein n=1 Tax=Canibacter oris TaxID=1365628 RepID=A0A840DMS7_9MICO|nr:hypothetical protein [Canibacter oris]MBB4070859.1 hypothetical protein [Canibacter oris]
MFSYTLNQLYPKAAAAVVASAIVGSAIIGTATVAAANTGACTDTAGIAIADAYSVPYGGETTLRVIENDNIAGREVAEIYLLNKDSITTKLISTNKGVFEVKADNQIYFNTRNGYTGELDPVQYQIRFTDGTCSSAQISVTVKSITANPDTATIRYPGFVELDVLANDSLLGLRAEKIEFLKPDNTVVDGDYPLTEGVFTVVGEAATGLKVRFDTRNDYYGKVPEVRYRVIASNGSATESTINVTVVSRLFAEHDSATTPFETPLIGLDVLANDRFLENLDQLAGLYLLDKQGNEVAELQVNGGIFKVNQGKIDFYPASNFVGAVEQVKYRVSLAGDGRFADATISIDVSPASSANPKDSGAQSGSVKHLEKPKTLAKTGAAHEAIAFSALLLAATGTALGVTKRK